MDSVSDDLVRLWSGNLHTMVGSGAAKLDWYYRRSPAGRGRVVVLRAQGDGAGAIVGCEGIGFRRIRCGDRELRAALVADLAVEKAHRTLFPALMLVRRARAVAAGAADFQYAFPNHLAAGVLERAGYRRLGRMVRYAAVLRFAPYLAPRVRVPFLARTGGAVLDAAAPVFRAPPILRAGAGHRLEFQREPDARLDALFEEARRQYRVIADRGREFLRWRFAGSGDTELATLIRRDDGALRAYAVVTRRGDAACLSDFLAASERELAALLALLLPSLRARGFSSASARFVGAPGVPHLLRRCGFRPRDDSRAVFLDPGSDAALASALADVDGFYLTDADEDN